MARCVSCGEPVPEGQKTCSMCYGDPDHGRDGYYKRQQEQERRREPEQEDWGDDR